MCAPRNDCPRNTNARHILDGLGARCSLTSFANSTRFKGFGLSSDVRAHNAIPERRCCIAYNDEKRCTINYILTPFVRAHVNFTQHNDIPMTRLEDLRCRWDFTKVKVHLVPSIAGRYEGWPKVSKILNLCITNFNVPTIDRSFKQATLR